MAGLYDLTGGQGSYRDTSSSSKLSGDDDLSKTVAELQKSVSQLIDLFSKQGSGGAVNAIGGDSMGREYLDMLKRALEPQAGTINNPLAGSAMMQTPRMANGPYIQDLGGMPPGYNDSVAKKLAIGANAGNILGGLQGQQGMGNAGASIGQWINRMFGGGR